jgi:PDZ domain-containing protein
MTTTSTELTRTPSLLTDLDPPDPRTRAERRWWLTAGAAAALSLTVFLAAVVQLPYLAYRPGGAQRVEVAIDGAPNFPPEDGVAFTTVSTQRVTLLEALRGWIDDSIELSPTGNESRAERQRYNAQLMDLSKVHATAVALTYLGYPVTLVTSGTVVRDFAEGSPANGPLEIDDVIVAVDGAPVDRTDALRALLQVGGPGTAHVVTVERPAGSATRVDVEVTTFAPEEDPTRAIIGIIGEDRIVELDLPEGPDGREWDVTIDSGTVGGPSAGLAFALTIIDVLTPGELTGGHRVAVTGTMEIDGRVGPVGGGLQKSLAVRNAGYEAFLVPSDEHEAVEAAIGDDVEVIAVDTLQEALDALDSLGGNVASLEPAGTPDPT